LQSVAIERIGRIADQGETLFLIRSPDLKAGDHILTTQLANAIDGLKVQGGDAAAGAGDQSGDREKR
jgi:hypothetical protein